VKHGAVADALAEAGTLIDGVRVDITVGDIPTRMVAAPQFLVFSIAKCTSRVLFLFLHNFVKGDAFAGCWLCARLFYRIELISRTTGIADNFSLDLFTCSSRATGYITVGGCWFRARSSIRIELISWTAGFADNVSPDLHTGASRTAGPIAVRCLNAGNLFERSWLRLKASSTFGTGERALFMHTMAPRTTERIALASH